MLLNLVLEKTLENPLDSKEIKPVNPKGNQPFIFIGKTDAKAPILWSPDVKSQHIGKDPEAGKDWGQEEKEDEIIGWHHRLNGHEFEQTLRDSEGQGSLACCHSWVHKELDPNERLNFYCWSRNQEIRKYLFLLKLRFFSNKSQDRDASLPWQ